MISLSSVTKTYRPRGAPPRVVLDDVSIEFPTGRNVGIFGLNGVGKSTLIRLLAGSENPDRGQIMRSGLTSFPLGLASIFHPDLTGRENVEFIARIYGLRRTDVCRYVESFSELGAYFDAPVKTYSSGMTAKLAFGACLAVDFDVYLIDEITEVGDGRFREKALAAFKQRMRHADIIIVSHNIDTIRQYCDMGAILSDGKITLFNSVNETITAFRRLIDLSPVSVL